MFYIFAPPHTSPQSAFNASIFALTAPELGCPLANPGSATASRVMTSRFFKIAAATWQFYFPFRFLTT